MSKPEIEVWTFPPQKRSKSVENVLFLGLSEPFKLISKNSQLKGYSEKLWATGERCRDEGDEDFEWNDSKGLTLEMVASWITETGGHPKRLTWWKIRCPGLALFKFVVEPLLSIRTTGSITVERVAKT